MKEEKCKNCRFWDISKIWVSGYKDTSYCRINPPIATPNEDTVFPITSTDQWCGKWEERNG